MTRLGNQKPTTAVLLPYEKTYGDCAIEWYEKSGRKAQQWQKNLINHILAINDDGLWTHTKFGFSLPRRNGKNEVVLIRELYGLLKGEEMLHTAHRTNTSHTAWERIIKVLESMGYVNDENFTTLKAKGNEEIRFVDGGVLKFRTRTSTGGLGEGYDLLVIDEAQEYTDDQQSALKYVVTSSKNPQTVFIGTPPTTVSAGTVFLNMRNNAIDGGSKNTGWAEWGIDEESDVNDVELWYKTNPSLGTIFTERSIEDEIGTDDLDFNIQRLGLWIRYNQKSAITQKDWDSVMAPSLPVLTGKINVGIKYGNDGKNVAMAIAIKTLSGKIFVEAIDCRSIRIGNGWIINFLRQIDYENVVIDGASGQEILKKEMDSFKLIKPILPTVSEIIVANSKWEQAIFTRTILHKDQASLTDVVTNCLKRNIGSHGGFGYKSQFEENDISLMDACILAHWICSEKTEKKKQKVWC